MDQMTEQHQLELAQLNDSIAVKDQEQILQK